MRVLLASAEYLPFRGGVAEVVAGLAAGLASRESRVTVLTRRGPRSALDEPLGYDVREYPAVPDRYPRLHILIAAAALLRCCSTGDTLVAADYVTHRALSNLPSTWVRRHRPWILTYGSDVLQHAHVGRTNRRSRMLRESAGVFAISHYTRRLIEEHFPGTHVEVVYPGIRESLFTTPASARPRRDLMGRDSTVPIVVCIGRLDPRKGQDTLIRAIPAIASHGLRPTVIFIGDGPYRSELNRLAAASGCRDQLRFVGTVSDAEKVAWIDAADLVVQPSRRHGLMVEGLGLVMAEAGARGKAVLSSRSGGVPEVIIDGTTGRLLPEDTPPAAWGQAIAEILQDAALRSQMGKAARAHVFATFRWGTACAAVTEILTAAAGSRS